MSRSSPPPLSPDLSELLAAEREIPSAPAAVRRRALLRARTAQWHVRHQPTPGGHVLPWFRRLGVVIPVLGLASVSLGAWLTIEHLDAPDVPVGNSRLTDSSGDQASVGATSTVPTPSVPPEPDETPPPAVPTELLHDASPVATEAPRQSPRKAGPSDLTLLEQARRALVRGEFRSAVRMLNTHKARFPNSELGEERDALRVRALEGAGQAEQAKRAASGFEQRHPDSVLAPTLKQATQDEDER